MTFLPCEAGEVADSAQALDDGGGQRGRKAPSVAGFALRTRTAPPPPLRQEARMEGG